MGQFIKFSDRIYSRFSYKPMYYDETKERLQEKKAEFGVESLHELNTDVRGSIIRRKMSHAKYQYDQDRADKKRIRNLFIGIFALCAVVAIIYSKVIVKIDPAVKYMYISKPATTNNEPQTPVSGQ